MIIFSLAIFITSPFIMVDAAQAVGQSERGEYVVRFADHVFDPAAASRLGKRFEGKLEHVYKSTFYGRALSGISAKQAATLQRHPDVDRFWSGSKSTV